MSIKVSQKDYLKKYLSGEKSQHKKKKRKTKDKGKTRVRIIDDDVDIVHNAVNDVDELILTGEDAPQIVGVIDDRPAKLKTIEDFRSSGKWKSVSHNVSIDTCGSSKYGKRTLENLNEELRGKSKQNGNRRQIRSRSSSCNLSPKRKRNNQEDSEDLTPKRNRDSRELSEDLDPRRRRDNRERGEDHSPRRKKDRQESSEDLDPRRRRDNREYGEDLDPRRRKDNRERGEDLSPRQKKDNWDLNKHKNFECTPPLPKKTLQGKKAGLQDAKALKQQSEKFRKREDELFKKMTKDISGKDAEIAVRDSSNKHRKERAGFNKDPEEEERKMKLEKHKQEIYNRWGKGLKQIEDYTKKIVDEEHEMSKPLTRYSDDADLDEILKKQDRLGDPMLDYIKKKNKSKETGALTIPVYVGPFPENRFNIRPGYRWDGVDRSNGYEKQWFDVQSKKKAIQEEAYKYSTEDM